MVDVVDMLAIVVALNRWPRQAPDLIVYGKRRDSIQENEIWTERTRHVFSNEMSTQKHYFYSFVYRRIFFFNFSIVENFCKINTFLWKIERSATLVEVGKKDNVIMTLVVATWIMNASLTIRKQFWEWSKITLYS